MGVAQSTAACCMKRGEGDGELQPRAERLESWHSIPDAEEHWKIFDDLGGIDGLDDVGASNAPVEVDGNFLGKRVTRMYSYEKLRGRPLKLVPEEAMADLGMSPLRVSDTNTLTFLEMSLTEEERGFLPSVPEVAEIVRSNWTARREHPETLDEVVRKSLDEDGFPELEEWTSRETCLRMLRAMSGDIKAASDLLTKAIECRVRDRELFSSLACDVCCDIRVIGRDNEQRPTVYICARSQKTGFRNMAPQILLAFEAAVKLMHQPGTGQVALVADMYGFSTSLNMDPGAIMELGGTFGSVFADRFAWILMVDFSIVAQGIWNLAKPLISEKTKKKINFVSCRAARELVKEHFAGPTCERITASFDINRERRTSEEERTEHALHTSICDVPLGAVRSADIAG